MKSKERIKTTAEIFTPTPLVNEILDKLNKTDPTIFTDSSKTFLDNSCGNGQFLIEVVARKYEHLYTSALNCFSKYITGENLKLTPLVEKVIHHEIMSTTFGVDIMVDNVCDTIARIIFFLQWQIDIFDEKGNPVEGLTEFGGYEEKDNADFNWLEKNHNWVRTYTCRGHTVKLRPCKNTLKADNAVGSWWMMEYSINDSEFKLYPSIICADALKYHYRFDGSHPYDVNKQQRLIDDLLKL